MSYFHQNIDGNNRNPDPRGQITLINRLPDTWCPTSTSSQATVSDNSIRRPTGASASKGSDNVFSLSPGMESRDMFFPPAPVDNKLESSVYPPSYYESRGSSVGVKPRFLHTFCVFCRNNGEAEEYFKSHTLKDDNGRTLCPVLRKYRCPTCGASGQDAHTLKYCPKASKNMDTNGAINPMSPQNTSSFVLPSSPGIGVQYTWSKETNSHNAAWTGSGIRRVPMTSSSNPDQSSQIKGPVSTLPNIERQLF